MPGSPLVTTTGYDADANPVAISDANAAGPGDLAHTVASTYDLNDRQLTQTTPRSPTQRFTTTFAYSPSGDRTTMDRPGADASSHRVTTWAYDRAHRLTDTVVGAPGPDSACGPLDDAAVAGSGGGCNVRTQRRYDADGHVVASFDPGAFVAPASASSPDTAYMTRTDFDPAGRAVALWRPRYADAASPDPDPTQSAQCPTGPSPQAVPGVPGFRTDVHLGVCVTRVGFDPVGNRTSLILPTAGPTAGPAASSTNRRLAWTYTDDNLVASAEVPLAGGTAVANACPAPSAPARVAAACYRYDADARPTFITMASVVVGGVAQDRTQALTYSADGLVTSDTAAPNGALSHVRTTAYDANGQPTASTDGAGRTTTVSYYANGLRSDVVDGAGDDTHYGYDHVGNPTVVFSPSAMAHDPDNPPGAGGAFPNGLATTNSYSADNLLATTAVPTSSSLATTASGAGSTWRVSTYGYDQGGRRTTSGATTVVGTPSLPDTAPTATAVVADAGAQTMAYSPADRLVSLSARAVSAQVATSGTDTFSYDPAGRPTSQVDSLGTTSTLGAHYYPDGLVKDVTGPSGTTALAYDGSASVVSRRQSGPQGGAVSTSAYTYNDAGLVASMDFTPPGAPRVSTQMSYDPAGRPSVRTGPDAGGGALVTTDTFAPDDTLVDHKLTKSATTLADWAYAYNGEFQQTTQAYTGLDPGATAAVSATFSYAYDPAGRLGAFTDPTNATRRLRWDHDSNRLGYGADTTACSGATGTASATCATYHPDDSLAVGSAAPARAATYTATGATATDGCRAYAYDGLDRLVSAGPMATSPCGPSPTASYAYDALGRQVTHTDAVPGAAPTTTAMAYDALSPAVATETGPNGTAQYGLEADGRPWAVVAPGATQVLETDGQGDVTTVANLSPAANPLACTARFDPFATPDNSGTTPCGGTTTANDISYKGARKDSTTNDYQFGSRTYDPAKAAFLTPDTPMGNTSQAAVSVGTDPLTRNTYAYVNGDPVNLVDPTGHEPRRASNGHWVLPEGVAEASARINARHHHRGWLQAVGHGVSELARGAWEGTVPLVEGGLLTARCAALATPDCFAMVAKTVDAVVSHPGAVLGAMVDVKDFQAGHIARGIGHLLPVVAGIIATRGAASLLGAGGEAAVGADEALTAVLPKATTLVGAKVLPEAAEGALGSGVAAETAGATQSAGATSARGLSDLGGVLSHEVNEAGGTVWTSTGAISQNDVDDRCVQRERCVPRSAPMTTPGERGTQVKTYKAMVWKPDSNEPGQRVTVVANSLRDAQDKLEAEYGEGTVFDLHNEDDAAQPR